MNSIELIFFLLAIHFLADFPFQGDFLALNKGKSWEVLFYHCAVYTGTFVLFGKASVEFAAILFLTHFVIDALKARYKVVKTIWQDQILHTAVIIFCVSLKLYV